MQTALSKPEKVVLEKRSGPEVFVALVGAIGTEMERVSAIICQALGEVSYTCQVVRLSELLHEIPVPPFTELRCGPGVPEDDRYKDHMNAGNELRQRMDRGDALALLAIGAIREERESVMGDANQPIPRRAYVLRSLKDPREVETLRKIYGPSFFLVGAYSARETRINELARRISASRNLTQSSDSLAQAEELNRIDEREAEEKEFGQNVRDTFPMADVFVDASDFEGVRSEIDRWVEIVFGYPFHTPTKAEYAMFHAQAAAVRSASLSRQVGAVICTPDGDIIAVGTNEVPKPGGGLYWCDDDPNRRDFIIGRDTSDEMKAITLKEVLERLSTAKWFVQEKTQKGVDELAREAVDGIESGGRKVPGVLKGTRLLNLIEFVRAEHGEAAAIMDAARRGVSVKGCDLYCTTFPCHDCAKHIVASGIRCVYYVQPYAKSLARELQMDSISVDSPRETEGQVNFHPFVGIAPRRYLPCFSTDLFGRVDRKQSDGKVIQWKKSEGKFRFEQPALAYLIREQEEFERFERERGEKGLGS